MRYKYKLNLQWIEKDRQLSKLIQSRQFTMHWCVVENLLHAMLRYCQALPSVFCSKTRLHCIQDNNLGNKDLVLYYTRFSRLFLWNITTDMILVKFGMFLLIRLCAWSTRSKTYKCLITAQNIDYEQFWFKLLLNVAIKLCITELHNKPLLWILV